MNFSQIVLVTGLLILSACAGVSEREQLLNHCRHVYQQEEKKFSAADGPQVELTASAGSLWGRTEPLLYQAAAFRLRNHPEESQQILQEIYLLGRTTEAILNASWEDTGSMESMARYARVANLTIRQVEIFLAAPENYALWQRIKSASGEIQRCSFTMQNGLSSLDVISVYGDEVTLEAQLQPDLCFSFRDVDYAILRLDLPQAVNSDYLFMYLMRIRNRKMEIVEQLPLGCVESCFLDDGELLIKGKDRRQQENKKVTIELSRL